MKPCALCSKPSRARGLCMAHYQAWRRGNLDIDAPLVETTVQECLVGGCSRTSRTKGLCSAHYMRHLRGQPLKGTIRGYNKRLKPSKGKYGAPRMWTGGDRYAAY